MLVFVVWQAPLSKHPALIPKARAMVVELTRFIVVYETETLRLRARNELSQLVCIPFASFAPPVPFFFGRDARGRE